SVRPAALRAAEVPREPGAAPAHRPVDGRERLRRDRRAAARAEHARRPRSAGEDAVRGRALVVHRALPPAARAGRPPRRARGAAARVPAPEVPVSFAAPLFLIGCAGALLLALPLVVSGLRAA